jgi:hypothetical protein
MGARRNLRNTCLICDVKKFISFSPVFCLETGASVTVLPLNTTVAGKKLQETAEFWDEAANQGGNTRIFGFDSRFVFIRVNGRLEPALGEQRQA